MSFDLNPQAEAFISGRIQKFSDWDVLMHEDPMFTDYIKLAYIAGATETAFTATEIRILKKLIKQKYVKDKSVKAMVHDLNIESKLTKAMEVK